MRAFNKALSLYWAIQPEAFQAMLNVLSRRGSDVEAAKAIRNVREDGFEAWMANGGDKGAEDPVKALLAQPGKRMDGTRRVVVRDKTAIIRIEGVLVRRADLFSEISGGASVERLAQEFTTALNDKAIDKIVLYIDSPGGEVNGINEFAQMIYESRSKKPITAYSGGMCCSGAYWIGTAAESLTINDTAIVGSIGVLCTLLDTKGADAMDGYKEIKIVSSQSPDKALDPDSQEGRAAIQQTVDALAEVFVTTVARNRGVMVQKVLNDFGGGGVLVGRAAVAAGLADKLGSFEAGLAEPQPVPGADLLPSSDSKQPDGEKKSAVNQSSSAGENGGAQTGGYDMKLKDMFAFLSPAEKAEAKELLAASGGDDDTGEQKPTPKPADEPKKPEAGASTQSASVTGIPVATQNELDRLRAESAQSAATIASMRAEQRKQVATTFVDAQLAARKLVPAEAESLRNEYLQALIDDEIHPVAEGAPSRAANIVARQEARPAHLLTEELMNANIPKDAIVLGSREKEDLLESARVQAEKYAEDRNKTTRASFVN